MTSQSQRPSGTTKLVHASFVLYLLSYALPAVVIAGDLAFGFMAAILSFVGLGAGRLERGQAPACLLGALANLLMVGGYISFNLRRFFHKIRTAHLLSCWVAGLAAVCAAGSGLFLATGSESFVPRIGYFVWLLSMIFMSVGCWKWEQIVDAKPDAALNGSPATPGDNPKATERPPLAR